MKYRTLGTTGIQLSAIGLGCMGMSSAYGTPDEQKSLRTLERSIELGINFWDTADIYGNGANETLISKILHTNRDKIFLATKFGFRIREEQTDSSNIGENYVDASPRWMRHAVEYSLQRLKTDTIDLYYGIV